MRSEPIVFDTGMTFCSIYICIQTDTWLNQRGPFLMLSVIASIVPLLHIFCRNSVQGSGGMVVLIGKSSFISKLLSSRSSLEIMRFVKSL